jgi:hypothetical protein
LVAPNTFSEFESQKYPVVQFEQVVEPRARPCLASSHYRFDDGIGQMI